MMENIYGQKTDNASNTFEKIRRVKLFSDETDNLEIIKKMDDVTVELCIKCEDVIEAFYQYEETIFSKDKDEVARKLLYNALSDSKKKFFSKIVQEREESVSYYKKTIEEITEINNKLRKEIDKIKAQNAKLSQENAKLSQENAELSQENADLLKNTEKIEENVGEILVKLVRDNPVKGINENVVRIIGEYQQLLGRTDVLKQLQELKKEKSQINDQNLNQEQQLNQDSNERE